MGGGTLTSSWSKTTNFAIESAAQIIGVCLDWRADYKTGPSKFYWIDRFGNKVDSFDFHNHPTFQNISVVVLDRDRDPCEMVQFPLFYIKTATSGPAGTFSNGKKCWWISDKPAIGFRPHPAFKRSTKRDGNGKYVINTSVYLGRYLSSQSTINGKKTLTSKYGVQRSRFTLADANSMATLRNDPAKNNTGWRVHDIHDQALVRILSLACTASVDDPSNWGTLEPEETTQTNPTGSTKCRMTFKGTVSEPIVSFDDAWRCGGCGMHGFYTTFSRNIKLINPMDGTSMLSVPSDCKFPTISGPVHDIQVGNITIGDDTHNMMEYFIPKSAVSVSKYDDLYRNVAWSPTSITWHTDTLAYKGDMRWSCGNGERGDYYDNTSNLYNVNDNPITERIESRIAKS